MVEVEDASDVRPLEQWPADITDCFTLIPLGVAKPGDIYKRYTPVYPAWYFIPGLHLWIIPVRGVDPDSVVNIAQQAYQTSISGMLPTSL